MRIFNTQYRPLARLICVFWVGIAGFCQSAIVPIDFENLYPVLDKTATNAIPANYSGFQWSSTFRVMTKEYATAYTSGIGYKNGMLGNVVGYTSGPEGSNRVELSSSTPFNFKGAYITSAWKINQDAVIRGFYQGQMVYRKEVVTSCDRPYWFEFNFYGIDRLDIVPGTGGTDYYYNYRGNHLAVDGITLVPEPATLMLAGLGGLILRRTTKRYK